LLFLWRTVPATTAFVVGMPPSRTALFVRQAAIELDLDFSTTRKESYHTPERPRHDGMIRAALGEDTTETPIWLFRQAGRHLPEYRDYKQQVGRTFLDMLWYPEVCC
jgi:hypothetical protein